MDFCKDAVVLKRYETCCKLAKKVDLTITYLDSFSVCDGKKLYLTFETVAEILSFVKGYCVAKGIEC